MKRLMEQLQSDEAVLLMYLAGELPGAEQEEIEARLEKEEPLRGKLEEMRATQERVLGGMGELDASASSRWDGRQEMAAKNVTAMMRQWQVDRMRAAAAMGNGNGPKRHAPWWAYSSAAAALILIGWVAWWGITPVAPVSDSPIATMEDRVQISDMMISAVQQEDVAALDRLNNELNTAGESSPAFWIDSTPAEDEGQSQQQQQQQTG